MEVEFDYVIALSLDDFENAAGADFTKDYLSSWGCMHTQHVPRCRTLYSLLLYPLTHI